MKKVIKVSTVVMALMICFSSQAASKKFKNPTFKKLRTNLWYMGVSTPTIASKSPSKEVLVLPEELKKALEKARGL
ncbi:MAG: hypothetical protein ACJAT2_001564 [Bacteriovoracaceae bacterium]|jgi:hypothetical protein